MKLTPCNRRLLVALDPPVVGTIVLPPSVAARVQTARILAASTGSPYEAGWRILFEEHREVTVAVDGQPFVLVHEENVLAVVEP